MQAFLTSPSCPRKGWWLSNINRKLNCLSSSYFNPLWIAKTFMNSILFIWQLEVTLVYQRHRQVNYVFIFVEPFSQQILKGFLLCARHCSRCNGQTDQNQPHFFLFQSTHSNRKRTLLMKFKQMSTKALFYPCQNLQ